MDNITLNIKNVQLKLKTKPGVFSAKALDDGTRLLIDALPYPEDNQVTADLGSGVGIIGLYLAKQNPRTHVHLLDDHLRSTELSRENADLNNLKNLEIYLSDLFSGVKDRTYRQIISNPPQQLGNEFLEELVDESFKHLKTNGLLWLVVKSNVKTFMERIVKAKFDDVETVSASREHVILKAVKN